MRRSIYVWKVLSDGSVERAREEGVRKPGGSRVVKGSWGQAGTVGAEKGWGLGPMWRASRRDS